MIYNYIVQSVVSTELTFVIMEHVKYQGVMSRVTTSVIMAHVKYQGVVSRLLTSVITIMQQTLGLESNLVPNYYETLTKGVRYSPPPPCKQSHGGCI